jgi:hypothetical protein
MFRSFLRIGEVQVARVCKAPRASLPGVLAVIVSLAVSVPAGAYDYPLTSSAIRDAYFLGTRQGGLGTEFLSEYRHTIPGLRVAEYISFARIETPFVQVAVRAGQRLNYSAQDAVEEFHDKPLPFRIHLEICYKPEAPPDAVKIRLIQNRKEITPDSVERTSFYPATDAYTRVSSIGEILNLQVDAPKIDSSTLTIKIETPDDQHASVDFDLQSLR